MFARNRFRNIHPSFKLQRRLEKFKTASLPDRLYLAREKYVDGNVVSLHHLLDIFVDLLNEFKNLSKI